jgi:flagellar M-ring protein FliF
MPDQVKKFIDPIKARWDILTPPQRHKLLGVIAVVLVALILTAYFAFRTPWTVLVARHDWQTISEMQNAVSSAGIRNKMDDNGTTLKVDTRRVEEARAAINLSGAAPNNQHFTWADALDTGLGTTDDERRRLDILGMQGAIERQLYNTQGVSNAIVNLSIPTHSRFERNPALPSASVSLTVTEDFSPTQGRNLALLVARNVTRLPLENIIIMDQFARTIFSGEEIGFTLQDETQRIRDQHINQVQMATRQLFAPILDEVSVSFLPVFDDRLMSEEVRTIYSIPEGMDGGGIPSIDRGSRSEMEGSPGGWEPGLQNNAAQFPNYLMPGGGVMSASQRDWITEYLVNTSVLVEQLGSGWVDPDASHGAVVGTRLRRVNQEHWLADAEEGDPPRTAADWERFKNEGTAPRVVNGDFVDFYEFHALAASAMGLPASNVTLVIMEQIVPIDTISRVWDWSTIFMVAVLILLLGMLLWGLLRKNRAAGEDEESLEPQLAVEDLLVSTQLEEAREEAAAELEEIDYHKENEVKRHIEKFINEKPEAVASLLRNWINVEEW